MSCATLAPLGCAPIAEYITCSVLPHFCAVRGAHHISSVPRRSCAARAKREGVNHACSVLRHSCAVRESTSHRQCPAVASTLEGTFCSAQRTCGTSQATPRSVLARHVDDQHHGSCKVFMTLQRSSYVEKEFRTPRCFNVEYCRILHSGRRRDAQVLRREHCQTCVEPFA